MADVFGAVAPLVLGGSDDDVRGYELHAAVAILRITASAAGHRRLKPSTYVPNQETGKLLSVRLASHNFLVEAVYSGPERGTLLVALTDYCVVVDLNANRYEVPLDAEDIDYDVEGTTRPVYVWHDQIAQVRSIVDAAALQVTLM